VTHPKLTKVSLETAHTEIENSKHFLEDPLPSEVVSFAYPKGDHNEAGRASRGRLGFKPAVTVRKGLVDTEPNWLALPRLWVRSKLSPEDFSARISPEFRWYDWLQGWD
jgi:peptidoglycan/xylan/chitin deacetylase (PgdA/CDA1 family)